MKKTDNITLAVPSSENNVEIITLPGGEVVLIFKNHTDSPSISEYLSQGSQQQNRGILLELNSRKLYVDNKLINLFGKEFELLQLLYMNLNTAVTHNLIKLRVWPERLLGDSNIPDVGSHEISALVYRLRKKLGRYEDCINVVPKYGYRMDKIW